MVLSFADWKNVDLRVGLIEKVEEIEGKDKLYKLSLSFGEEKRVAVAGIKKYYLSEQLEGKKAIFAFNLEPAKIAGIESNAMVLAAKSSDGAYKIFFSDDSVVEGTRLE
ncbi:MAG: methionine--tRNA ligase subunit beta [archaeon]|jgi:methionine--tRNA ligase beta chain